MNRYLVTINVKGVGDYQIELASRNPEAAGRRAIMALWMGPHRNLDLDAFEHTATEELGALV